VSKYYVGSNDAGGPGLDFYLNQIFSRDRLRKDQASLFQQLRQVRISADLPQKQVVAQRKAGFTAQLFL